MTTLLKELIYFMETLATCWKGSFHLSAIIYLPQLMSRMCTSFISLGIYNGQVTVFNIHLQLYYIVTLYTLLES